MLGTPLGASGIAQGDALGHPMGDTLGIALGDKLGPTLGMALGPGVSGHWVERLGVVNGAARNPTRVTAGDIDLVRKVILATKNEDDGDDEDDEDAVPQA
mgnify:CR=1 FL=1